MKYWFISWPLAVLLVVVGSEFTDLHWAVIGVGAGLIASVVGVLIEELA